MKCQEKWCSKEVPEDSEKDICRECQEAKAFSQMETPKGGWPKNSQADRL